MRQSTNIENLLLNEGVISFKDRALKDINYPVPVSIQLGNLFKKRGTLETVAMNLLPKIPGNVQILAGVGFTGIPIAMRISQYNHKTFIPLEIDKHKGGFKGFGENLLKGKKIMLIAGKITTGINCRNFLDMLKASGGECKHVACVVDYGFKLASKVTEEVKIISCTSFEEITKVLKDPKMVDFFNEHNDLFREKQPAVAEFR